MYRLFETHALHTFGTRLQEVLTENATRDDDPKSILTFVSSGYTYEGLVSF